jgi:hypothetical protein
MTGMGMVPSTAANTSGGTLTSIPGDCISTASTATGYLYSLNNANSAALTSIDGAVIQSSVIDPSRLPPCLVTLPTATVGGQSATVVYAGWVKDSIAGLYQVNVTLPATATLSAFATSNAPAQLPVIVTLGTASQTGVTMWVSPKLQVLPPGVQSGTVGVAWGTTQVAAGTTGTNLTTASDGLALTTYSYALSSGVLPNGLVLDPVAGGISGTPAAYTNGTYPVTVTATDSETPIPLAGKVTFSLTIADALVINLTPVLPADLVTGTLTMPKITNGTIGTIQANGGTAPYVYTDATTTLPAHLTINSSTGVITDDGSDVSAGGSIIITVTDANGLITTFPFTLVLD